MGAPEDPAGAGCGAALISIIIIAAGVAAISYVFTLIAIP